MRLAILICRILVVLSAASAHASNPKLSAVEGDWAENCAEARDEGFAVRYSFEFLRSGGSIKFDDGVDVWWRGTVTAIDVAGRGFVFTYSTTPTQRPRKLSANLLPDGRLEIGEPDKNRLRALLTRCAGPNHRVVEKLKWQQISALTPSRSSFIYFVNPGTKGCSDAKEYLHFDLIGPADYSVWGYGDKPDGPWKVERANDDKGAVRLDLSNGSERTTIWVRFPDNHHIQIEPWHKTLLRCEE